MRDGAVAERGNEGGGNGGNGEYPRRMRVDAAARRLNVAVVCPRFPLPMTRADQMTVAHLLAFLSARGHAVDLYSLYDHRRPSGAQRGWVASRCREMTVFEQPRWRRAVGAGAALLRGRPLQVGWFHDRRLARTLRRAARERRHDVVYAYTLRSAEAVRGLGGTGGRNGAAGGGRPATYLAMQVSQALNTRRIAACAPTWGERLVYRLEHRLTSSYETRVWRDFTRTVLIGEADAREIREACAARGAPGIDNHLLAPHGVDAERFRPRPAEPVDPDGLVFCGVMATNTNVSAVLWFTKHVWPRIRAEAPEAKFTIVGRLPRHEILGLAGRDGITVTGEVPDPAEYVGRAAVCVNPMQAGAGMQNKLLEYMAMGKAVVATPVANEGIAARPGRELLIAGEADRFAAAVVSLLRDARRRTALGEAARARVLRDWTWESNFLKLESDFVERLPGPPPRESPAPAAAALRGAAETR